MCDTEMLSLTQRASPSVWGEQSIVLAIAYDVQGFPWGPLDNNLTICNPLLALDVSLADIRYMFGALSPSIFGDSIQIHFIYVYTLGSFQVAIQIIVHS